MKRIIISLLSLVFISTIVMAQEEQEKPKDKPVSETFASGYLIDNQTTMIQYPKTLEFTIQHKFGAIENGKSDVWGIYSSANVRLSLDYAILENLQVGYGLTKTDMVHDLSVKYNILQQTRKNTIPVSVSLYGNMGINGAPEDTTTGLNTEFKHRISLYGQLIISRKFSDRISLQTGASFAHFNQTNRDAYNFDRVGIHFNGRVKLTSMGSFIFNYDQPLKALQITEQKDAAIHPNVSFGWEIATVSHAFQIYMGYSKEILPQYYMVRENSDFAFDMFRIGFTMTRLWNF